MKASWSAMSPNSKPSSFKSSIGSCLSYTRPCPLTTPKPFLCSYLAFGLFLLRKHHSQASLFLPDYEELLFRAQKCSKYSVAIGEVHERPQHVAQDLCIDHGSPWNTGIPVLYTYLVNNHLQTDHVSITHLEEQRQCSVDSILGHLEDDDAEEP